MEVEEDRGGEGEEGDEGTQRALGALEFLTQDADPSGTTLVDARNGFNEMSRLEILWTVQHRWPAGVRFAVNCCRHWAQLLLRQPGELPVTILSRDRVAQGDCKSSERRIRGSYPLSMWMMQLLTVWRDKAHIS